MKTRKTYKTNTAKTADAIRRDMKNNGIKCSVRSYNGFVAIYKQDLEDTFSQSDAEFIKRIADFYELTGVYGTDVLVQERPRFELYL